MITVFSLSGQKSQAKYFHRADYITAAVAAVGFGYLFCTAAIGLGSIDESCYCSIVQRQLVGDRLLIDDWHLSQLFFGCGSWCLYGKL